MEEVTDEPLYRDRVCGIDMKEATGDYWKPVSCPLEAEGFECVLADARQVRHLIAAHAQLLLARPLTADLRRPWEKQPDTTRPLSPGRVRRGFLNIRPDLGTPACVPKPARPGPGRPKGSGKGPAPRHLLPGEAGTPRTTNTTLTRQKVKS